MSPSLRPRHVAAFAGATAILATAPAAAQGREPFPGLDATITKAMADWKDFGGAGMS